VIVKRILLVDDDPDIRSLLQDYLEIHGHAVETAQNGREALTKLDQAGYDAVVTDCNMPGLDGLAVLRHVRQNRPSLPVVMMTGEGSSQLAVQTLVALGAQACLFKPFALQELAQIMKNL
jgi:two-component system, cell cycle response regulator